MKSLPNYLTSISNSKGDPIAPTGRLFLLVSVV